MEEHEQRESLKPLEHDIIDEVSSLESAAMHQHNDPPAIG